MIGIYRIYNTINDRSYIGQSTDIKRRLQEHYRMLNLLTQSHHSDKLQEDWDKYGADVFRAEVVEECPENLLDEREKYWIDFYEAGSEGYNIKVCKYNQEIKEELAKIKQEIQNLEDRL